MDQKYLSLKDLDYFDIIFFLDCEYTCWENSMETLWSDPKYPMELIQVGIGIYDLHKDIILETYSKYIRPNVNPILSNYCKNLLKIEQDVIDNSDDLQTVFREIKSLIIKYSHQSLITCSWGTDRECINNDAKLKSEDDPFDLLPAMNLQVNAAKILGIKDREVDREEIKNKFGIPMSNHRHDALEDALDVKNIMRILFDNSLVD